MLPRALKFIHGVYLPNPRYRVAFVLVSFRFYEAVCCAAGWLAVATLRSLLESAVHPLCHSSARGSRRLTGDVTLPLQQMKEPRGRLGDAPADHGVAEEARGNVDVPGHALRIQRHPQLALLLRVERIAFGHQH